MFCQSSENWFKNNNSSFANFKHLILLKHGAFPYPTWRPETLRMYRHLGIFKSNGAASTIPKDERGMYI